MGSSQIPTFARLLADAQLLDESLVPLAVLALQELEQARAAADHHQQPAARREVLLVDLQVLREVIDLLRDERDLDLGAAGVLVVRAIGADERLPLVLRDRHDRVSFTPRLPAGPRLGTSRLDLSPACLSAGAWVLGH